MIRPRASSRLASRTPGALMMESIARPAAWLSPAASAGAAISATTAFIAPLVARDSWRETAHCWSMKVAQAASRTATVVIRATLAIRAWKGAWLDA